MADTKDITGIILAGGKSERFGTDKAFAEWDGVSLLTRAIGLITPYTGEIVISGQQEKFGSTGLRVIEDITPGKGPAGGLASCLSQLETAYAMVLAVDYPYLKKDVLEKLLEFKARHAVVIAAEEGQWHPLVGIYQVGICNNFRRYVESGILSMHELVRKFDFHVVSFGPESGLRNVNKKEELI